MGDSRGLVEGMNLEDVISEVEGWINPGGSVIVDPAGRIVAGPANEIETILYADVQQEQLIGPRWQLDIAGHYARPDVFELRVHRRPTPAIQIVDDDDDGGSEVG